MENQNTPKILKKIEVRLITSSPEVAAYFGGYIDGIHDTCASASRSRTEQGLPTPYGRVDANVYTWTLDLNEHNNLAWMNTQEIQNDFRKQIMHGLESIFKYAPSVPATDSNIQVREI